MGWRAVGVRSTSPGSQASAETSLLAALVKSSDDAIVATSLDGRMLTWNQGAELLYGYRADEVLGSNVALLAPSDRTGEPAAILNRVAAGERIDQYETVNRRKDGTLIDVAVTVSPIQDALGRVIGASAIARDITRQKRIEALLAHQALHDPLTELPNRVLLRDRIQQALARAEREGTSIAVCFLDLDGFKALNDKCGHRVGDQVLQVVAARLRDVVRADDTVARLGGDEFVIVCHHVRSDAQVRRIAQRIAAAVATPVNVEGAEIVVQASVGAVLGEPETAPESLLHQADSAMYHAKQQRVTTTS